MKVSVMLKEIQVKIEKIVFRKNIRARKLEGKSKSFN